MKFFLDKIKKKNKKANKDVFSTMSAKEQKRFFKKVVRGASKRQLEILNK